MVCDTCHGEGAVIRPIKVEYRTVVYRELDVVGGWKQTTKSVVDRVGGIDACPDCAALAHARWIGAISD